MPKPATYELKHPVMLGSERIESLTLQPLKVKHMRRLESKPDDQVKMTIELLEQLTGQNSIVIDELDFEDFTALAEMVGDFLGGSQLTGET